MASTQRTESGKWTSRVYVGTKDGKRQYKRFTADTKKEVERMANLYLLNNQTPKYECEYTVREAMESYIASKKNILSPSTVAGYEKIKRNWLQSLLDIKIKDLTKEIIQKAVNEDSANHSPKTVRNSVGLLTSSLAMYGYKVETTLPQKKKVEIVIPTDEEMNALCEKASDFGILAPVMLASYMGLRRSEISAIVLEEDMDRQKNVLHISKAIVVGSDNRYVLKGTKTTESTRVVPIPQIVRPVLEEMIQDKKKMPSINYIEKNFIKLRDSLGLNHITFHSLRHYFASTLVVLDVPDFYAMKLMGHNSDRMLKSVYQHIKQDYMDSVAQKIDLAFEKKAK